MQNTNDFDKAWKIKICPICEQNKILFISKVCHSCRIILLKQLK